MESRVMGNCHARFGAGEKFGDYIKKLPIVKSVYPVTIAAGVAHILHDGSGGDGGQTPGAMQQKPGRCAKPPDGAMGCGMAPAVSRREYPCGHESGF